MFKRIVSVVLAAGLSMTLLAGCGGKNENTGGGSEAGTEAVSTVAETTESEETTAADEAAGTAKAYACMPQSKWSATWDCSTSGFDFAVPENLKNYMGQFFPAEYGDVSGNREVYQGDIHYIARTDEEMAEFDAFLTESENLDPNDQEAVDAYNSRIREFSYGRSYTVMLIMGIKNTLDFDEVVADSLGDAALAGSGELGTAGDYNFYYVIPDYSKAEDDLKEDMPEEFYTEFMEIMEKAGDLVPCISVKEPPTTNALPEVGDTLNFETTDLEGNAVTSEELFAGHKVTMINLWATWCGPCVNELAKLEEFNKELAEKDCQIVGICLDTIKGETTIEKAKGILAEKGVTYTNLVTTELIESMFPVMAVPTSYFVNSEGVVITEAAVGADFNAYRERIEEALQSVGE